MRLQDRVAIVTGGSRGIGRAIALAFAREGAKVVVAARDLERAERTAAEVRAMGVEALAAAVDVSRRSEVEAMVARAVAEFGRIDVLVSNAGIGIPCDFLEMTEEAWDRVIAVNLKGVFLCGQVVARQMVRTGSGSIINVSSNRAEFPDRSQTAYAASKGGVNTLTKAMAIELAPYGIRVNALGPGTTLTDFNRHRWEDRAHLERVLTHIPLQRMADPEDMAGAAVFLASDEARMVTGHCLYVDGGSIAGVAIAKTERPS